MAPDEVVLPRISQHLLLRPPEVTHLPIRTTLLLYRYRYCDNLYVVRACTHVHNTEQRPDANTAARRPVWACPKGASLGLAEPVDHCGMCDDNPVDDSR